MTSFTRDSVATEGCTINFWSTGGGPLLIFIPGGNGHGRQYDPILPYLALKFTVATYDRRQMSSSLPDCPFEEFSPLNPAQQARDARAIMKSLGFSKTAIFGSSLGGVIAFQFAVSYPESLSMVLCHEAPTFSLLPDSTKYLDWFFELLGIYRSFGAEVAQNAFNVMMVGMEDGLPRQTPEPWNQRNFWANEVLTASTYCPDLRQIVNSGVPIAVGYGTKSLNAAYCRTTIAQEEILGCKRIEFPGHHQGFETEPVEFANVLLKTLKDLETLAK